MASFQKESWYALITSGFPLHWHPPRRELTKTIGCGYPLPALLPPESVAQGVVSSLAPASTPLTRQNARVPMPVAANAQLRLVGIKIVSCADNAGGCGSAHSSQTATPATDRYQWRNLHGMRWCPFSPPRIWRTMCEGKRINNTNKHRRGERTCVAIPAHDAAGTGLSRPPY